MSSDLLCVRDVQADDLDSIVDLDASRSGKAKRSYWSNILSAWLRESNGTEEHVALVATNGQGVLHGVLFGEVRAWEFGSERCGWIFSLSVHPEAERCGVATQLMDEAVQRFDAMGIELVRTMVRRNDVPMLSFFRSQGFAGGPFSELERPVRFSGDNS
jgi:ribosomal protein S18 acetylase RimI-like enzyme